MLEVPVTAAYLYFLFPSIWGTNTFADWLYVVFVFVIFTFQVRLGIAVQASDATVDVFLLAVYSIMGPHHRNQYRCLFMCCARFSWHTSPHNHCHGFTRMAMITNASPISAFVSPGKGSYHSESSVHYEEQLAALKNQP